MYNKIIISISVIGVLFSGYLSAVKFFTSTCALNEPCPYFLGFPACWYGLVMFLIIATTATLQALHRVSFDKANAVLIAVSILGVLFAGYFTIPEIREMFYGERVFTLGLPTCSYGLIFYILVLFFSLKQGIERQ